MKEFCSMSSWLSTSVVSSTLTCLMDKSTENRGSLLGGYALTSPSKLIAGRGIPRMASSSLCSCGGRGGKEGSNEAGYTGCIMGS